MFQLNLSENQETDISVRIIKCPSVKEEEIV